jgi:transcriptional regulator with XRE-family HTH domain
MADRRVSTLGEIIRQQRELAEFSMRQFADLAGISNPYLSQIERGLRAPSQNVLDGIARALKLSSDALYEQAGMSPPGADTKENEVLEAINADERLTARQRAALREVYEAFVATSPRQPRRRNPDTGRNPDTDRTTGADRTIGARRNTGAGRTPEIGSTR